MHPILSRIQRLALYLLAWVPIGALFAATLRVLGDWSGAAATALALPMALVLAFLCLAVWPLCRALPLGRASAARLFGAHGGSIVVLSSLWILSGRLLSRFLDVEGMFPGMAERYSRAIPVLAVVGMLLLMLSIVAHYLLIAFEKAREAERTALEVQVHAREAELRALKAQINPHFLFNSLNSISALAGQDAAGARRMSILLADFLRRSMRLGAHEQIALADELELAADYLAVEQIRFGERLKVERDIEPEAAACKVPALLLQPLLENAIKHGIAHTVEGGVLKIEARRRGGRLELAVENPCDPERPPTRGQGMGIPNVRSRLANFHPGNSHVLARELDGHFTIEVSLPAVTVERAPTPPVSSDERAGSGGAAAPAPTPGSSAPDAPTSGALTTRQPGAPEPRVSSPPSISRGAEPHGA